ncbi:MAG: hypothetical protein ABI568_13155 [Pseudarthrobacter sp.]
MTKAKDFLAALRSQQIAQPGSAEEYWKRQQSMWLDDLSMLRDSIRQWMSPVVEDHSATIEDRVFSTMEPDLGRYDAPGLEFVLLMEPPQVVLVRPRGLRVVGVVETGGSRVVGASGRVDLECGVKREIVLRFRKDDRTTWYSFSAGKKRELDEDVFFDLLARTTDIRTAS